MILPKRRIDDLTQGREGIERRLPGKGTLDRQERQGACRAEIEDEQEHGEGEGLERLVAPQGDEPAERAGRQGGGREDDHRLADLEGSDAAEQHQQHQRRHDAEQQEADRQQRAENLAEDDLVIAQVGQQQEEEGAAILFLRQRVGGRQGGEEEEDRELDGDEDLKRQEAEASLVAEAGSALPADGRLPDREQEDPESAEEQRPREVVAAAARGGEAFANENRPEHACLARRTKARVAAGDPVPS